MLDYIYDDWGILQHRYDVWVWYKHVISTACFNFLPYALRVLLTQLFLIVALLLIRCGDVEINSGPIKSIIGPCGVLMFVV